jgi:nucleotide-binding universal stress UspA family protein
MQSTVVVPLDGSDLAERALPYAARIARTRAARLVLVRVEQARLVWEGGNESEFDRAQSYLSGLGESLASPGLSIETLCAYGDPADQILKVVDQFDADEIVMSTHGRTGFVHLLHGSVAEAVLARSRVPVLLVGARIEKTSAATFDPGALRVLLALDGSDLAQSALPAALDLLGPSGELILCRIVPSPVAVVPDLDGSTLVFVDEPEEAAMQSARNELDLVASRLRQTNPNVAVSIDVRTGEPAPGIVKTATERFANVVVMTSHGRTGLSRSVYGSVTGSVARTATMPVLVIRPAKSAPAATAEAPAIAAIY